MIEVSYGLLRAYDLPVFRVVCMGPASFHVQQRVNFMTPPDESPSDWKTTDISNSPTPDEAIDVMHKHQQFTVRHLQANAAGPRVYT